MELDENEILKQLDDLESILQCNICRKKSQDPVRVRACDHYFCKVCLKSKESNICPKCKTYYQNNEADYNTSNQLDSVLTDFQQFLLEAGKKEIKSKPIAHIPIESDEGCCFKYYSKKYHVNYIDQYGKVNSKGETSLHVACKKKKIKDVIDLLGKVDINVKDFAGWAPLHEAAESGSIEIVEILLKHGALIDIPGLEYTTPLHKVVTLGNLDLTNLLLKYGASTTVTDYGGKTPLDYAPNVVVADILLEAFECERTEELYLLKKFNFFLYYTDSEYKEKLIRSKRATIIDEFDEKKITYLIIKRTHKPSLKIFLAMLQGCILVPQEWIDQFLAKLYFVDIQNYIFTFNTELNNGIKRAILNSLLKGPKLFDGISFYISGHSIPVKIYNTKFSKEAIASLITCGGGKILHRASTPSTCNKSTNFPYHSNQDGKKSKCCHYIIFDEAKQPVLQYHMEDIQHKSSRWLLDCIMNFTLL